MAKKKSSIKIGAESVAEYGQIQKNDGWKIYIPPKANRWTKHKDIFNLFDILCMRGTGFKLVQVKTNNDEGSVKIIRAWALRNHTMIPKGTLIEVAVKRKATKRKIACWKVYVIDTHTLIEPYHYERECIDMEKYKGDELDGN